MFNRFFIRSAITISGLIIALPVKAQGLGGALKSGLEKATPAELKEGEPDLVVIVGNVLSAVLAVLGVVLLIYLIWGGYKYMTAKGDSKKVDEGIDTIRNSIIGMIIIALSFAIANFVIKSLAGAVGGEG